ncbi:hypothetical protein B0A55_04368 [Friedmanniomyces simplex]|uniref:SRR1-like domain-containing protein n=1 Tax=Friedmanniomyces simplex TaxID=329884 RepID=A0A4U0XSX3_9PEZI|nr:hypothetical protein B0A55_04368 [Friedmanniomyces simplex]
MPCGAEEQLEEGWTRVGKGKRYVPEYLEGLDPPVKGLTVEHVHADFEAKSKLWRNSTCRKAVLAILDKQQPDAGWQLTEAVCLATNSFSRDNWQARQRSMMQWAAFFDITQYLQNKQDVYVNVFAQEPNYTLLDKQFLEALNVQVLEATHNTDYSTGLGEAKQFVVPSAFVFEPFMKISLENVQDLFGADPALYIGSSVERSLRLLQDDIDAKAARDAAYGRTVVDIDRKKLGSCSAAELMGGRRSYRMPRFEEDPNIFEGLLIYWKQPHEEDAEDG